MKEAGVSVKVINMKPYKDPDEFIKNLGAETLEERLKNAENSFFFEKAVVFFNIREIIKHLFFLLFLLRKIHLQHIPYSSFL